ncbi:three-Cys-motif partner protein TcmP [Verminephrobacter eiseniae]|uniref:three-Cys-motif partner protein TcmP n=1 Tax=Verminephrobacter eiseniae TaxID=364317 RepID=UPI00223836B5|nr:three-Cys-motif partner protein TcmP [Verminephrobacter eiseniae]MCW5235480.1 three-Cys-motif partner protein TcmP [Verminephrobacter eiseniae]
MTRKSYDWKNGTGVIQQHSIAKHKILQFYLAAYFKTLVSSPNQDILRLTLVDGFAGGGLYVHNDTNEPIKGSPLIFLNATREAEYLINKDRTKKVQLKVDYFFVESDRHAHTHLDKVLRDEGYGSQIGETIHLRHAKFQDQADHIIDFIKRKSPKNGRSIFALDQYGYKDVPTPLIRKIFANLSSAEIILTFAVDSFVNFASDEKLTQSLLNGIGIPDVLKGRSIKEIKSSERDWRLVIQSSLRRTLVEQCGAEYFTPFFIRNNKGYGDYWLIHLSRHHKARDVMTEVHWDNNNYFIHYGGAGLDMFQMVGYDPDHDDNYKGQDVLGFEFDDEARKASIRALNEHIPKLVYANDEGVSFGALFATTCNDSPASSLIYRESVGFLIAEKAVDVVSEDGVKRRTAGQIRPSDQIITPRQRGLFIP